MALGLESEAEGTESSLANGAQERPKKIIRWLGWSVFGFASLLLFTLTKLPEDKIVGWIQNSASSVLASRGATLTVGESGLSLIRGFALVMKDVRINYGGEAAPSIFSRVILSPSWVSLLTARLGVKVVLEQGASEAVIRAATRGKSDSIELQLSQFDLGKSGLLSLALSGSSRPQADMVLDGKAELQGAMSDPSSWQGGTDFTLSKIQIPNQAFMGFQIPKLTVSDGALAVELQGGKLKLKSVRLGKTTGGNDDIKLQATGEVSLGKTMDASQVNFQLAFSFSKTVTQAFSLLDAFLGAGKQADGSFKYSLTGPLLSPAFTPIGPTGK